MLLRQTILFDKSVVIGLPYEDFKNVSHHFAPFITPPLIDELIGELGKRGDINRFKDKLKILSAKCLTIDTKTISTYNHFLLSNLMGEFIPLDGRIPENRGARVRYKDGNTGYIIGESEDIKMLKRWSQGQFFDSDFKRGDEIKEVKNTFKHIPQKIKEMDKNLDFHLQNCSNISDLRDFVDDKLNIYENNDTKQLIDSIYSANFHNPLMKTTLEEIFKKWESKGSLPLSQYAEYAFHCLKLEMIYNMGIKCNIIPTAKSQNTYFDLQYFYYLPFCHFFSSDDKFHKKFSPLLLREKSRLYRKK